MNHSFIRYSILIVFLFTLGSWGEKAHQKINSSCVEYFPKELNGLKSWSAFLGDHGSDADDRKKTDKNEFVRHFIDIDIYEDFIKSHKIAEDFNAACTQYGKAKVIKNGTLPWVTDSTYRALVNDFKSRNWQQAELTAADLGHYVGDGFMPLHITTNYNGQLSNQKGIHSRYEITMIDKYIDNIHFKTSRVRKVKAIQSTIFEYLYTNYNYVSFLLQADSKAFKESGKQYNDTYYASLWKETSVFTTHLLQESSKTLASLIYTAWLEAGRPEIPANLGQ
ncbi:MAG TPA: hypothetical protein DCL77_06080 [Prolixibacteraceae bacterium]|jgi:hypothetical protein|nr:hypothetical protein [Prolixibacteraceae bacterium]